VAATSELEGVAVTLVKSSDIAVELKRKKKIKNKKNAPREITFLSALFDILVIFLTRPTSSKNESRSENNNSIFFIPTSICCS
jgi:hypothetical protein